MTLHELLAQLQPAGLDKLAIPRHLMGSFRRKSISFCTGMTDETTVVYWFQSKGFSIDLRLPDGADTPVSERQGWIGDTQWDEDAQALSWQIERSYQPRNQWPEPATLRFIGNSVLEFAPSGAYIEDWRQQSSTGPLLGLRLIGMVDHATGVETSLDGGIVIAGEHIAYARSRVPQIDDMLRGVASLEDALTTGLASADDVESYEVSVAIDGDLVTHSTQPRRLGQAITDGDFSLGSDGRVAQDTVVGRAPCTLRYDVDLFAPGFSFDLQTPSTADAADWMEQEKRHLFHHAVLVK